MTAIYFHYPYCRQACTYCNFHFSTSLQNRSELLDALLKELRIRKDEVNGVVESIYLGGGTPSLLSIQGLGNIIDRVRREFIVDESAEITLEANPDDLSDLYLKGLMQIGINRISLGIQSFIDSELKIIGRTHDSYQAQKVIEMVANTFENFSVDLIFGLPRSTLNSWEINLIKVLDCAPKHLSLYGLTVESNTLLKHQLDKHKVELPPERLVEDQYLMGVDRLTNSGFIQYEISNFAKNGYQARHNSNYWNGKAYLGIGPSAHSFDGNKTRSWNVNSNPKYIDSISRGQLPMTKEILNDSDLFNEYLLTGFRTNVGVSKKLILKKWGYKYLNHLESHSQKFLYQRLMLESESTIKLSNKGKLLADGIIADLFVLLPEFKGGTFD